MNYLRQKVWSPYVGGALLGVLSWITFAVSDKALGVSTTFVRATGSLLGTVNPQLIESNSYYAKYLAGKPAFEWQFALVIALAVGAFVAAKLSGEWRACAVPKLWEEKVGGSAMKRRVYAFVGGALLLFGARLAGGCTSGHGISGGMQLAVSGYVFIAAVFAAGIPTAFLLYRKKTQ